MFIRLKDSKTTQQHSVPRPSGLLLSFLNHLQITVDVSYVPPITTDFSLQGRPIPIRTTSINKDTSALHAPVHLLPPQTPRPIPKSDESDEKYANIEGVLLKSFIWGDDGKTLDDTFRLMYSNKDNEWVAVYKINVIVCE